MGRLRSKSIRLQYRSGLRDSAGNEAHAAAFIRKRLIVLDEALLNDPEEHARVLIHELFHFVWVQLGNGVRADWEQLMRAQRNARGEAGWSAEWRKKALRDSDVKARSRRWREYCCEAFCDTAAAQFSGCRSEVTLGRRAWKTRADWFIAA